MKILVTGGVGFLGSHLCRYLLQKGHHVVCMDNFFTGRTMNILDLEKNPKFKIIPHDIINPIKIEEHFDRIYNLACPASPPAYQFDSIKTIQTNTVGVMNVLEFAKLNGARVLQTSTSEIYGDPLEHPQKETYRGNVNTIGPRACYDEGKRVAETLFMDYHRKYGLQIRIVRIFNTYGPSMDKDDGRVVSNFIMQALNNNPLTMYGIGKQTRSFCYVSDLVEGLYKMMESNETGPVNLGNPGEFTMLELAEKIIKLTNSKSKIEYKDLPQDDPQQRKPDITLAKNLLKWQPTIQLNEGLKKTIDYFKWIKKKGY
ncbi:MAG: UDP-glucuronic acid decarboxylase family protein [Nanoarchaeota archaeon]